jgi:TonB-dependent starch-binding outer membrane protein SusC
LGFQITKRQRDGLFNKPNINKSMKITNRVPGQFRLTRQNWIAMKLFAVFMLAALLQVSAKTVAQINYKAKNAKLETVFAAIKQQTGFTFFYNKADLSTAKPVSVDFKNASLQDALENCLEHESLTYDIEGKTIVISPKLMVETPSTTLMIATPVAIDITGKVTNDKGEPLEGATVLVKGSALGTKTDVNGNFSINADPNARLVVSFIGFESREILVNNRTNITIQLNPVFTKAGEEIVIGYGTSKKANVTTAISSVTAATIDKLNITRVEQALQGSVPGVLILNQNGQPGDKPMIRIRGTGTNNSPDPLFLVDGFPVSSIEYLNPGDIDRIDVLKDAASAAIYGARGANGVVLITTKTGKRGTTSIAYDGYYGMQNAWRKLPVLNATQYATLMNEGAKNANPTNPLPYADPASLGAGTNWQNALFQKNVPVTNHQVTASGGNDKATYLTSFSYFDQQGVIGGKNSEFKRYTFRLNLNQKVTDYLRVGTNLSYINSERRAIFDNGDQGGHMLGNAVNIDPITPVYETDPAKLATYNANAVKNGTQVYGISPLSTFPNPLAQLAITSGNNKLDKLFGNVYAELSIFKGLKFKSSYSMDLANATSNSLNPIYYLLPTSSQTFSKVNKSFSRSTNWQIENVLSYSTTFNKHSIDAVLGQSALKYYYEDLGGSRNDPSPIDPNLAFIDVATDASSNLNNGGADTRTLASYFGRLGYSYDNKYLVSGVLRRDGSSRFGSNNPWATFPSVSAGWLVSNENFFKSTTLTLLKLRGSWGQNGNENLGSSFPWASTIGTYGQGYTFLVNGVETLVSGASLGRISNTNLKWETSEQTDLGFDAELWKGKVAVTADYYIKKTKDLLIAPDVPLSVGFPAPFVNGGNVENRGIELGINYNNRIGKDLKLNLSFNISHNTNKVTQINNTAKVVSGAAYISLGSITRMAVGEPIGYFWGVKTAGIFQTQAEVDNYTWTNPTTQAVNKIQPNAKPGDLKFVDFNNDGKINDNDRTNIGDPNPKYTTGFTINLTYKNFDLSIFTIGMFGNKVFNGNYRFDKSVSNLPAAWLDRWTPDNPGAKYPRFVSTDPNKNTSTVSDFFLENGSFVRVKNLQIGYSIPDDVVRRTKIHGLRLYAAVDNAFTFTKYTGFDPEIGATSPLSLGIDRGVYPQSRTFRFGVNLKL